MKNKSVFLGWYDHIPVYTDNNMNPHCNNVGGSGSGKTSQMIMMSESFHNQGGTVLILNYSGIFDQNQIYKPFLPYFKSHCKEYALHEDGLLIDIFKRRTMNDGTIQNEIDVVGGISDAMANSAKLSDKQKPVLRTAINKLYENGEYYRKGIKALYDILGNSGDPAAIEIRERLYYILVHNVFRPSDDNLFIELNKINVINMSGFNWEAQRLITEVLLNEIFSLAHTGIFKEHPLMLVLDEIQNFDNHSIIPRLLNEARRYGIGIVTGTQLILKGSPNKIIQRLPGAAVNLIFKPQFNRIQEVARTINPAESVKYAMELGNLKPGEFIAIGSFRVGSELFDNTPLIISAYIDENETFLKEEVNVEILNDNVD